MQFFNPQKQEPKAGDIVGFLGNGLESTAISLCTYGWPWFPYLSLSHVGILADHNGELLIFESNEQDMEPCVIQGKTVSGTQAHTLESRVKSYDGLMWHYPLSRPLYDFESKRLSEFLLETIGLPYDKLGAFRAGGIGWSWVESQLYDQNLNSIFCSEWCAAAHTEIGIFHTDHVSRWSPNYFCRTERRQGILLAPRRLR